MAKKKEDIFRQFRCVRCGKLLAREDIKKGNLEIKCRACGAINLLQKDDVEKIFDKSH